MAGILISMLPVVTEAAAGTGLAVAELTGSAAVGSAAEGAVIGAAATAVNQAATTIIDSVFGQGTVSGFEDKANKAFQDLLKTGYFTNNANTNDIVKSLVPKDVDVSKEFSGFVTAVGDGIKNSPTSSPSDVVKSVSEQSPFFWYLGTQVLEFTANFVVPSDPLYQQVAAVYTAEGWYDKLTQFDPESRQYYFTDEAGSRVYWDLSWNTYVVVPPMFGTYVGYSSPNNDFPARYTDSTGRLRESVLDSIAMSHDSDYKLIGLFSKFADYKLISRIQAQKDKMVMPNEREVANVAVSYFSTLGDITRKFFGVGEDTEALIKKVYREIKGLEVSDDQIQQDFNTASAAIYSGASSNELLSFINNMDITLN